MYWYEHFQRVSSRVSGFQMRVRQEHLDRDRDHDRDRDRDGDAAGTVTGEGRRRG